MTRPGARSSDLCPICGGALIERDRTLYCPSCDLVYEHDEHDGAGGSS